MLTKALSLLSGPLPARLATLTSQLLAAGVAAFSTVARDRPREHDSSVSGAGTAAATLWSAFDMAVVPTQADSLATTLTEAAAAVAQTHRPVLVVPTDRLEQVSAGDAPDSLLDHIVVLADYAFGAACAHACAIRLAAQGARRVTLRHTHGLRPRPGGKGPGRGELQWVDFVRVELLKNQLLHAGVEHVVFQLDEVGGFTFGDGATTVVLGGHCRPDVIAAFAARMSVHAKTGATLPAVLLPAGACCPSAATAGTSRRDLASTRRGDAGPGRRGRTSGSRSDVQGPRVDGNDDR